MPEKLDRCVRQVMAQGHSEDSAFAICNAAMGEAEWPDGTSEGDKQFAIAVTKESLAGIAEARNIGHWLEARIHNIFTDIADDMFGNGHITREERISLSDGIGAALDAFSKHVEDNIPQVLKRDPFGDPETLISRESIVERIVSAIKETFAGDTKQSTLIESGDEPKLGNLVEKAVRQDGSIEVKVIEEGWGSSGFYPREILERDGPKAFPKGTQMFWNHQTFTEELERPEGSLNDLAGVFISDARWNESGKDGPGLYADARITKGYQEAVNDLAPHIGVSIRAKGETKHGEAEGRRGLIVQSIDEGRSVDFVTQAGAGGKIIELFESKRGLNVPTRNVEADMSEQELQEARDALAERDKRIAELERERALNQAKSHADNLITEAVKDSKLPSVSIGRVRKMAMASIPLDEANELDEAKFKADVQDMVKDEIAYLTEVSGGVSSPVFGMGESSETPVENFEEQLEGIFSDGFGLSESAAKSAARR